MALLLRKQGQQVVRVGLYERQIAMTWSAVVRSRSACVGIVIASAICVLSSIAAFAAPPKPVALKPGVRKLLKIEQEYVASLSDSDPFLKKGMKADVYLHSGKRFEGVEITEVQLGKPKNSLKLLGCTSSKGVKQKIQPNTVMHIATEERGFDIVQDPASKSFVALDLARRDEQAAARLAAKGHHLWEEPSDEVRKETIEDAKKLFEKARELFPDHQFQLQETEYFLFFTDMPAEQIAGYVANLDTMYRQLCLAFGILPGKNIWKGKCPVLAFLDKDTFNKFEVAGMRNQGSEGAQGLCHGMNDGRVVITVYRGNDPAYFAVVLVHETAHGFIHRLRSTVHIDAWLNEGIADWIAGVAVPASDAVGRRQADGVALMRTDGSMGGFFDKSKKLTPTDYGIASNLTQFMLQTDANLYRAFLMAIKDGYPIDEALKLTYDVTPAELVHGYGNSIGISDLRP